MSKVKGVMNLASENRMSRRKLRGGVVGCGSVSNLLHIPTLTALRSAELVAVCDRTEMLAAKSAKRFRIPRYYSVFSEMLEREDLDFVNICTPPKTHSSLALLAMKRGLHVLVEKPMALELDEADKMLIASKKNNVKLCVMHNFLFNRAFQRTLNLVKAGAVGDLLAVDTTVLGKMQGDLLQADHWMHSLPGGIFGEFAPHAVYLEQAFLHNISHVDAIAEKAVNFPWILADELKVLLKSENAMGSIAMSLNSPQVSLSVDVFGTKRILHCDLFGKWFKMVRSGPMFLKSLSANLLRALHNINQRLRSLIRAGSVPLVSSFEASTLDRFSYTESHRVVIREFVRSIVNNSRVPVTGEEGREVVRILEEIWKQIGRDGLC